MTLLNQKTINEPINFSGVGLHSGKLVNLSIKPSEPNTGIIFKRVDLKKDNLVYPNFSNVSNTSLNTTISNEFGVKISTIEHLMGALFGLGVDNVLIEIDNEEVSTFGGLITGELGHIPEPGERLNCYGLSIIVDDVDGRRVIAATVELAPSQ